MAETPIEWTRGPRGELGYTFNGWIGCTPVSPGCDHCYAEAQDKFRGWTAEGWGSGKPRKRTSEANWDKPYRWNDAAAAAGERRRVFCSSLADVFDNEVPPEWRADLFFLIEQTPHLDWLLLTKRVGNVVRMVDEASEILARVHRPLAWPLPNVWLGATVVNQEEADRDIPKLLATPARVRFLSIEPMLGPIDLTDITLRRGTGDEEHFDALHFEGDADDEPDLGTATLDWVIAGGESGPKARPMHPDWARSLRDQCAAAGVPFLFKQWGEWAPWADYPPGPPIELKTEAIWPDGTVGPGNSTERGGPGQHMVRTGKKTAGRLLDGVTHDGFPEVRKP